IILVPARPKVIMDGYPGETEHGEGQHGKDQPAGVTILKILKERTTAAHWALTNGPRYLRNLAHFVRFSTMGHGFSMICWKITIPVLGNPGSRRISSRGNGLIRPPGKYVGNERIHDELADVIKDHRHKRQRIRFLEIGIKQVQGDGKRFLAAGKGNR